MYADLKVGLVNSFATFAPPAFNILFLTNCLAGAVANLKPINSKPAFNIPTASEYIAACSSSIPGVLIYSRYAWPWLTMFASSANLVAKPPAKVNAESLGSDLPALPAATPNAKAVGIVCHCCPINVALPSIKPEPSAASSFLLNCFCFINSLI